MKQLFPLLFLLVLPTLVFSQIRKLDKGLGGFNGVNQSTDSLSNDEINVKLSGKTKYTDYKVISHTNDTTYIDTTLTIQKVYKFNFRRKDNFELLQFHNQGQTFNNLAYDFNSVSLFPDIGFRAKQFNYMNIEDIDYYHVPTPTTEIMYRTGQEQGQVLDALFTLNFSERLNVSVAYKGLRSLGQYRRSLAATGNFRTTLSYRTPKEQYAIRAHITTQDFTNQESGGLTEAMLQNFIENDPNFIDRARLDVNLNNTENLLEGTRLYIDHNYKVFSSKDSTSQKDFSNLKIGHVLTYENKTYNFIQSATTDFFGEAYTSGALNEGTKNRITNNQGYLEFNSKYILGRFKVKTNYTDVSCGYDSVYNPNSDIPKIKLKGKAVSFGAEWNGKIGNFQVNADATVAPGSGHLAGNYLKGDALYKKDSLFTVKGSLLISSKAPNFNFQLFQSTYDDYNWSNNFTNVDTRNIGFSFDSKWGSASLDFTNIEDYTYFDEANSPQQFGGSITYLKVKANKEFKYRKFALNNTVMYQNVSNGSTVFRVPEFVTRNTLYYMDDWFKGKPLLVQIGATLNYFTKYKANAYNPLLAEFTLQNDTEIGYPTLDVFFNARVRRTRIYFQIDNVTSGFTSKNYFSAPNYPYRDFSIRFGLVWNWFI
ncbi:putative beta-barrel porin [Tenacibaculum adriaticum]|uniref:Putative beta-barrel porin n=1 Tax=Tenacibaculum adriaticum TaxID=413713 RepID=A0A5S5E161_9FLAO|nr:putative porin [Tenacibaculum adriaticum]TYQ00380.1 putative beta-barrel porin [Tenacibaculum adriaticum]